MGLLNGQVIDQSDFVSTSGGSTDAGKSVKLNSGGKLDVSFLRLERAFSSYEQVDGSSIPKAMCLLPGGTVIMAGTGRAARQSFIGFTRGNYSGYTKPSFLNITLSTGTANFSHTAPAGNNRLLVLFTRHSGVSPSLPTAVSWNGQNFTQLRIFGTGGQAGSMWILPIGTSASDQTFTVTFTGGAGGTVNYRVLTYQNVNQSTPSLDDDVNSSGAATNISLPLLTPNIPYHTTVFGFCAVGGTTSIDTAGAVSRTTGTALNCGDIEDVDGIVISATTTSSSSLGIMGLVLNPISTNDNIVIEYGGVMPGFTGLTPNAKYYVQSTNGNIGTTPGSPSILVGKAISPTEILIMQS